MLDEVPLAPALEDLSKRDRILWRVTVGVLFAFALSLFVPWAPMLPTAELDASWYMVLHWAFLNGADFGDEIVFTYGPWGFLFQGYHPSTFWYSILGWTFFATVCFLAMMKISQRLSPRRWVRAIWLGGVLLLTGTAVHGMHDIRLVLTCWALLLLHFQTNERPHSGLKIALVLALALISLGKFSMAIVSLLTIVVISIDLLSRRIIPWVMYIYLGALAVLWLAAGQSPLSILPFLRHSFQITSGYAQGVGLDTVSETRDVLLFLVCALGFLGVAGVVFGWKVVAAAKESPNWKHPVVLRAGLRATLQTGALAAILFLAFKMGYIRHDPHELQATSCVAGLAVMYLAVLLPMVRTPKLRYAVYGVPVLCVGLMWISYAIWIQQGFTGALWNSVAEFPKQTFNAVRVLTGTSANRENYERLLSEYRENRPLAKVSGTVDGYSWIQYSLLAHNLDYRPRPIVQGYLSYAPELGRINVDFLRSTRAPDSVLLDVQNIDGCYPSLGEAASWAELLARYELKDITGGAVLLERSRRTRQHSRTLLKQSTATLGEWIPVPESSEPIWASIRIKPKLGGKIASALYKPPYVYLAAKLVDGNTYRAKLIPGIASEGFLLSPLVQDRLTFAVLYSTEWKQLMQGMLISEIQVTVGEGGEHSYAYESEFEVQFEELRFEHQDVLQVPGMVEHFRFTQFSQMAIPLNDAQKFVTRNEDWRQVLLSRAPTAWLLDVPPGATSVRVSFGLLKEAYMLPEKTLGVRFQVNSVTVRDNIVEPDQRIWNRDLNPAEVPEDRGLQTVDIPLPDPAPTKIILETVAAEPNINSHSYWADLLFQVRPQ